jgi:hypothetical protein
LGFLVSSKGMEPNLEKIQAILDMTPPQKIKKCQCLTKRFTALNQFISRLGECSLPFFKTLKKHHFFL